MTLSFMTVTIAIIALLLGGFAKGISGMGLPTVATPILALLFDLQTAIAIVVPATLLTDFYMLMKTDKSWALMRSILLLLLFGIGGIVIGSYLLVNVNQSILSGLLGIVVIIYVVTTTFKLLPTIKKNAWFDAGVGILAGTFQGSAGACGPIISMYLLQMRVSRNEFLFIINSFFVMVDLTQFFALYKLGLYDGMNATYALWALIPVIISLAVAIYLQKRISDVWFRYAVLTVLSVSGIVLIAKAVSALF